MRKLLVALAGTAGVPQTPLVLSAQTTDLLSDIDRVFDAYRLDAHIPGGLWHRHRRPPGAGEGPGRAGHRLEAPRHRRDALPYRVDDEVVHRALDSPTARRAAAGRRLHTVAARGGAIHPAARYGDGVLEPRLRAAGAHRGKCFAAVLTDRSSGGNGGATPPEPPHTTHFSIVDTLGNAVALTTTLNESYGAAFTVPGAQAASWRPGSSRRQAEGGS